MRVCLDSVCMGRKPSTFRKRDLTRAVEAVIAAGVQVARVEIAKDGRIVVVSQVGAGNPISVEMRNEWDDVA
jgi:hypothetical protein